MNDLGLLGRQMQISSWAMLVIYVALALLLLPRELKFLREAEPAFRSRFAALDIALQVCILLILIPCALVSKLTPKLLILIFSGFTGLWLVVAAMAYLRYVYTYKILARSTAQYNQQAAELLRRGLQGQDDPSGPKSDDKHGGERHG